MDNYKEFSNSNEVNNWVNENYKDWLKEIQIEKYNMYKTDIGNLLCGYSGNLYTLYNEVLRGISTNCTKSEKKKILRNAKTIDNEISKQKLNENVVVYRATHKKLLQYLNSGNKIKRGDTFKDNAFISTTLLLDYAIQFGKKAHNNCDCILKLYLPKGTSGTYISFNEKVSKLEESEFLLPKGCTFIVRKKYFNFKYFKTFYECEVLSK